MSNADPIAALYDHERDPAREHDRRRRDAHDWGADDLFDGTSYRGRRFERDGRTGTRERVVADWFADVDADPHADRDPQDGNDSRTDGPGSRTSGFGPRAYEHAGFDDDAGLGDDPRAHDVSTTARTMELDLPIGAARPQRRTVAVTGHPDAVRRAERAVELHHRRPARSIDDRIAHRPDHIAAYACALGVLLILIAVLSASP